MVVVLLPALLQVRAGLLGYGTGEGSCAAAPFRAKWVKWSYGCPTFAPCCSEYGYCRPLVSFTPQSSRAELTWLFCRRSGSTECSGTATESATAPPSLQRPSRLRQRRVTMREFRLGRSGLLQTSSRPVLLVIITIMAT